jgi:hypothetical protein
VALWRVKILKESLMPAWSRMLVCLAAGLLVTSHAPAAKAQIVADTLDKWGLLGTWAVDCSQPPSVKNGYKTW